MKRIFGTKKETVPPPSLSDAAGSIDTRAKALDAKIAGLDQELIKYKNALKKTKGPAANNIKRRAMETLKRKKMYETQRDQLAGQQFNVDQTAFAIDSIKDTQTTVAAMKAANKTLKVETKKINMNELEDVVDDLADMMEDMNEINETLGRSYATPDDIDEDDLEAELEGLGEELEGLEEVEGESAPAYLQPAGLPVEPTTVPESSGGVAVDEYGLPMAPTPAGAQAQRA